MAPKSKFNKKDSATKASSAKVGQTPNVAFPPLSEKIELECKAVLEDQILVIDVSVLTGSWKMCWLWSS